jgi:uncharacterized protein (DUF1015 family)
MFFEEIGLKVPTIYLPKDTVSLRKWSVIACDQYTSQPEYWKGVDDLVIGSPSTYHLIYPEVYLEESDKDQRIQQIYSNMNKYLEEGLLEPQRPGFILVNRQIAHGKTRKGLVVALDLEKYDYSAGSQTLIRATEGTIVDRLPPRMQIRERAALEFPHILVLIDDPQKTIIEPLFNKSLPVAYDFDLMMKGGHITGYKIENEKMIEEIAANIKKLADKKAFNKKYSVSNQEVLLYAMGDGNHSLATAKALWEKRKKNAADPTTIMNHPSRFALVELVNLHDEGMQFEAIHRVIFNIRPQAMLDSMKSFFAAQGVQFSYTKTDQAAVIAGLKGSTNTKQQVIHFVSGDVCGHIELTNPKLNLEVGSLQSFLDWYLKQEPKVTIDYVHGDNVVLDLGQKSNNIGFFLPAMSKHELFKTVILDGALPRKTFSMGDADEKRFYLEARKIID